MPGALADDQELHPEGSGYRARDGGPQLRLTSDGRDPDGEEDVGVEGAAQRGNLEVRVFGPDGKERQCVGGAEPTRGGEPTVAIRTGGR